MAYPDVGFFSTARSMPDRSGPSFRRRSDRNRHSSAITPMKPPDFLQASVMPFEGLNLVAGGRFDHFNQFGDIWTYRFAGSYLIKQTDTTLHASVATGFSPPSSQDKIFGNNFDLIRKRIWAGMRASSNVFGTGECGSARPIFTTISRTSSDSTDCSIR